MKEFDKWIQDNCENNCDISCDPDKGVCHRCSGLGTKEDAWKAALEWVLEKKVSSAPCKTPLDVLNDQIKEELEG